MDYTLVDQREIRNVISDGTGYCATLSCGHDIWFAIKPTITTMICAVCADKLFMPFLDEDEVHRLLRTAHIHRACAECEQITAMDYCRSCDEFYWLHKPRCQMHESHDGHRLTIVPFVEVK